MRRIAQTRTEPHPKFKTNPGIDDVIRERALTQRDVEIIVRAAPKSQQRGRPHVAA